MKPLTQIDRRDFIKSTASLTAGTLGLSMIPNTSSGTELLADERENVIGPREGFSPQIGTLLSMMTWMRRVILMPVKDMTTEQLDYLLDETSNSIGAMLFHLAATERFYQIHTFEGKKWGDWSEQDKKQFSVAMGLGDDARKTIKGNNLDYYLSILKEVRENTIKEFRNRDDKWLLAVDDNWGWGPTNNYCKWFHVCEHESNHNGQFKYIKSRLPGAKASKE
ncbi:MAG TPA: DinB family protein [Flavobacteriaceae bacterium]